MKKMGFLFDVDFSHYFRWLWKNPRKAVQPFENKKRKIDIFKNYEANGVEKIQRKLEIFSTLISKKSSQDTRL